MAANPLSTSESPFLPRQSVFIAEYLVDLNATQAAIRAGYEPESAGVVGSNLLHNPRILAAIERGKAQRIARVNMTADTVLQELSMLATSRIDHYVIDDDGQVQLAEGAPDGAMAAIQSVKRKKTIRESKDGEMFITYDVEIRLWDKPGALKLMGKHAGIAACFDRLEITGRNGNPIETITEVRRVIIHAESRDEQQEERDEVIH